MREMGESNDALALVFQGIRSSTETRISRQNLRETQTEKMSLDGATCPAYEAEANKSSRRFGRGFQGKLSIVQIIIIRGSGLRIGCEDYCFENQKFIHLPSTPTYSKTHFFPLQSTPTDFGRRRSHTLDICHNCQSITGSL